MDSYHFIHYIRKQIGIHNQSYQFQVQQLPPMPQATPPILFIFSLKVRFLFHTTRDYHPSSYSSPPGHQSQSQAQAQAHHQALSASSYPFPDQNHVWPALSFPYVGQVPCSTRCFFSICPFSDYFFAGLFCGYFLTKYVCM